MFRKGDDVVVRFVGRDHRGEVVSDHNGWVLCRIVVDPLWDYGSLSDRLDPISTVCVRDTFVRHTTPESH